MPVRGRKPLYVEIADMLKAQMNMGTYKPGDHLPPERELVESFECSRATIRLALGSLVSEGLVERRPRRGAVVAIRDSKDSSDSSKRAETVSIVLPAASLQTSAMRVLRACQSALYQNSCYAYVCDSGQGHQGESMHREVEHVESMVKRGVPGMIFWPAHHQYSVEAFHRARRSGLTMVLVDRQIPGFDCDYVGVDNFDGGYQATRHLISHGHRRIAHITHPVRPSSLDDRMAGYRKALDEAGIEYDENLVVAAWSHAGTDEVDTVVRQLAAIKDVPTAVFCATDHLAAMVVSRVHYFGWTVPGDAAVVGFDDDIFAKWSVVPLSTVAQPFEAIGEEAVRLLMSRIRDGFTGPSQRIILPPTLVLRQSCGVHTVG